MKEDKYLVGQIEDKILQCQNQYMETHTGFLDTHKQSVARGHFCGNANKSPDVKIEFYGGYEDAERVILLCLPEYETVENCQPLSIIRVTKQSGGRELAHGDYLGSILGLGIKREMIGDILVRENGADIIVLREIQDFLLLNYEKAGRTYLQLTPVAIEELIIPAQNKTILKDTVASLRIDNIVASAFGISRTKSAEAISKGIVFVNNQEINRPDYQVSQGDKIVLRGKGKVNLIETCGKTRKDRLYVIFEKF
ncbi:MAG: YlmH/Sll1252 family protein [Anaerovoracaceae bacterium]